MARPAQTSQTTREVPLTTPYLTGTVLQKAHATRPPAPVPVRISPTVAFAAIRQSLHTSSAGPPEIIWTPFPTMRLHPTQLGGHKRRVSNVRIL